MIRIRAGVALIVLLLSGACASPPPAKVESAKIGAPPSAAAPDASAPLPRVTPDAPFRAGPPPAGTAPAFAPPKAVTFRLRNGIPVTLVPQETNIVAVSIVGAGGVIEVGADKNELVDLALAGAMQGSKSLDREGLEDALAKLAMPRFNSKYFSDGILIDATMVAQKAAEGIALFADVVLHPAFDEKSFQWRAEQIARARDAESNDSALLGEQTLRRAVFGRHAYAAIAGAAADVRAVKRADAAALYARLTDASRLSIVVAGGIDEKSARASLDTAFGGAQRRDQPPRPAAAPTLPEGSKLVVVDKPGASVTRIEIGFIGPAVSADTAPAEMALWVLADQSLGRLTNELRNKHHAAWVTPRFWHFRNAGLMGFTTVVPTANVTGALSESELQLEAFAKSGPTDDELGVMRDGQAAATGFAFGTASDTADMYATALVCGVSAESLNDAYGRRAAVDAEGVRAAAARWLNPARMRVVLVGDWSAMRESVTKLGWTVSSARN